MLKRSGMAAFFPKALQMGQFWHSFGTALARLVLSLEKPVQNTHFFVVLQSNLKWDKVRLQAVVPLCFSVRSPMLKSLLRHIFGKKN